MITCALEGSYFSPSDVGSAFAASTRGEVSVASAAEASACDADALHGAVAHF